LTRIRKTVGVAREAQVATFQLPVQRGEHDVRQQRRERSALGHTPRRRLTRAVRQHHARAHVSTDQAQDTLVRHLGRDPRHEQIMVNMIEEAFQVTVHGLGATLGRRCPHRAQRIMRVASGPVGIAVFAERFLERPAQLLGEGLLDDSVQHRGNPKRTLTALLLGNQRPSHGRRRVGPGLQLFPYLRPVRASESGKRGDRHLVDPRGLAVLAHPTPCGVEIRRTQDASP
jgi:hypothetical protein